MYRIPGSDRDVKELKEKFLRKKNPDLSKVADTHVLCGCLKDFLRGKLELIIVSSRVSAPRQNQKFSSPHKLWGEICLTKENISQSLSPTVVILENPDISHNFGEK